MAQLTNENLIGDIDMAKTTIYKNPKEKVRVRDKKVGNKTTSYISHGEKSGPKGFQRKAKVVDKKLPTGKKSTALYGSKKLLSENKHIASGKPLRKVMKEVKQDAASTTINGKTYKTKNKKANPNLRKKFKGGGMMKKRMKRGGRAK